MPVEVRPEHDVLLDIGEREMVPCAAVNGVSEGGKRWLNWRAAYRLRG